MCIKIIFNKIRKWNKLEDCYIQKDKIFKTNLCTVQDKNYYSICPNLCLYKYLYIVYTNIRQSLLGKNSNNLYICSRMI